MKRQPLNGSLELVKVLQELQSLEENLSVAGALIFLFIGSRVGTLSAGPSLQDIAVSTGLTESRVSRNVITLEDKGLVRKDRDPNNARVKHVSVTDLGYDRLEQITAIVTRH